jgi:hypothetical protein
MSLNDIFKIPRPKLAQQNLISAWLSNPEYESFNSEIAKKIAISLMKVSKEENYSACSLYLEIFDVLLEKKENIQILLTSNLHQTLYLLLKKVEENKVIFILKKILLLYSSMLKNDVFYSKLLFLIPILFKLLFSFNFASNCTDICLIILGLFICLLYIF